MTQLDSLVPSIPDISIRLGENTLAEIRDIQILVFLDNSWYCWTRTFHSSIWSTG